MHKKFAESSHVIFFIFISMSFLIALTRVNCHTDPIFANNLLVRFASRKSANFLRMSMKCIIVKIKLHNRKPSGQYFSF